MNGHPKHSAHRAASFVRNIPTGRGGLFLQACRASSGKPLSGKAVLSVTTFEGTDASAHGPFSSITKRHLIMKRPLFFYSLMIILLLGFAACGGSETPPDNTTGTPAATGQDGLSQEQLENGIGPIRQVNLADDVDAALAAQGEAVFTIKCSACHKFDEAFTGPPLGQVLSQRTPEFVMNMMLNPDEMVQRHPEVKALLGQYFIPMPNQNLTEDDARAVLEYLRDNQTEATGTTP